MEPNVGTKGVSRCWNKRVDVRKPGAEGSQSLLKPTTEWKEEGSKKQTIPPPPHLNVPLVHHNQKKQVFIHWHPSCFSPAVIEHDARSKVIIRGESHLQRMEASFQLNTPLHNGRMHQ